MRVSFSFWPPSAGWLLAGAAEGFSVFDDKRILKNLPFDPPNRSLVRFSPKTAKDMIDSHHQKKTTIKENNKTANQKNKSEKTETKKKKATNNRSRKQAKSRREKTWQDLE